MEHLDVFSVRDLRNKSGELLRDAEAGHISLITKHGKPAILAVPFDERLISYGVHRAMALHLLESHQLTLAQSAKLAGLSVEAFMELLGEVGLSAVDYPPEELEEELAVAL
jgi:prevent-host-death family protein